MHVISQPNIWLKLKLHNYQSHNFKVIVHPKIKMYIQKDVASTAFTAWSFW